MITTIVDSGSARIKAGTSDCTTPHEFPSLLQPRCSDNTPKQIIQRGNVTDWEQLQRLWSQVLRNEHVRDHPMLMTDQPGNGRKNTEKAAEIMFELFEVPSFCSILAPVLSLYSAGLTTGVVLESGDGLTSVVPVYSGRAISEAIQRYEFGGCDLTAYLAQMLKDTRHYEATTPTEWDILREIKEKLCLVSPDCRQWQLQQPRLRSLQETFSLPKKTFLEVLPLEIRLEVYRYASTSLAPFSSIPRERPFELPDGSMLTLGEERIKCPEPLFSPSEMGREQRFSFQNLLVTAITQCDKSLQPDMYKNIVLGGGNTLFPGLPARLSNQIWSLSSSSSSATPIVSAPEQRKYSAWIGGRVLSSLSTFKDLLIPRADYEEKGLAVVL